MADFRTHITVAATISTPLALGVFGLGMSSINEAILYALAGTFGGILPDIDADESISIRLVFRLLGALTAGLILILFMDSLVHWQWIVTAIAGYWCVRFPLQWVFAQFTRHRGALHSLLANVAFAAVAVPLTYYLFALPARTAWGVGGFIFLGATIHLLLDEIYSIELSKMRVKRSFGTALKLTDWGAPFASLALVALCVIGFWLSPTTHEWAPLLAWLPAPHQWFDWGINQWHHLFQRVSVW